MVLVLKIVEHVLQNNSLVLMEIAFLSKYGCCNLDMPIYVAKISVVTTDKPFHIFFYEMADLQNYLLVKYKDEYQKSKWTIECRIFTSFL